MTIFNSYVKLPEGKPPYRKHLGMVYTSHLSEWWCLSRWRPSDRASAAAPSVQCPVCWRLPRWMVAKSENHLKTVVNIPSFIGFQPSGGAGFRNHPRYHGWLWWEYNGFKWLVVIFPSQSLGVAGFFGSGCSCLQRRPNNPNVFLGFPSHGLWWSNILVSIIPCVCIYTYIHQPTGA